MDLPRRGFCRLYTEQVKQHGATEEAVLETIRLCRDENVLTHYLDQHETEAKSIMKMIGYPSDTVRAWLSQAGGCA